MKDWEAFKTLLGKTPKGKEITLDFLNAVYILEVKEIQLKDPDDLHIHVVDEVIVDEKIS